MKYYVYVIENAERGKMYIGYTNDLEKRIARHNKQLPNKRSSYTSKMSGDWTMVYSEEYNTRKEAMKREKELKSFRGREFIKNKVKSLRP